MLCQLDGCLSAEGHYDGFRFFRSDDIHHVFIGQRLEIESVRRIEVRGYRFRIVVYDDYLISCFLQRPYTLYGGIVEFDSLADTDRTGAEYDNRTFFALLVASVFEELSRFVFIVIG